MIPLKAQELRIKNLRNKLESRYWYSHENDTYNSYLQELNRLMGKVKQDAVRGDNISS